MAATLYTVAFAPVTNETTKEVRALLKPVVKGSGVKLRVIKGSGSMKRGLHVQASYEAPSTPELRIAIAEALLEAGFECAHAVTPDSTMGLKSHTIRLAREQGHASIDMYIARFTAEAAE